MKTHPNEAAFPSVLVPNFTAMEFGLTKREEFAARFMASYLAGAASLPERPAVNLDSCAYAACNAADALIDALNRPVCPGHAEGKG